MPKIKIPSYECCNYQEVWEVLASKAGAMAETRFTGKYIRVEDVSKLDASKYLACSINTTTQRQESVEMELFTT